LKTQEDETNREWVLTSPDFSNRKRKINQVFPGEYLFTEREPKTTAELWEVARKIFLEKNSQKK
jgi:hypothetical protein